MCCKQHIVFEAPWHMYVEISPRFTDRTFFFSSRGDENDKIAIKITSRCDYARVMCNMLFKRGKKLCLQIENHTAKMRFSAATARKIQDVFISEMNKGIHQQPSSLQMENTYIPELLDGTGH